MLSTVVFIPNFIDIRWVDIVQHNTIGIKNVVKRHAQSNTSALAGFR
jgi:hypothetical protein